MRSRATGSAGAVRPRSLLLAPTAVRLLRRLRRVSRPVVADAAPRLRIDCEGQAAGDLIKAMLLADAPCMMSRLGATEMRLVLAYRYCQQRGAAVNAWRYLRGRQGPFWWDAKIRAEITTLSGVFPATDDHLVRFSERFLADMRHIDVLGSWVAGEADVADLFPEARIVPLRDFEPFHHTDPWTAALENRTVLVIHPFERSIREQYAKRHLLFADPRMLPRFTLKTLRAVQSSRGHDAGFASWFDALDWMCEQVSKVDFDVALIGAGAYGLPLAAFVKSIGRKAVHIGGATQLFFGIRGRRWDEWPAYRKLYNEHWTRPLSEEVSLGPLPIAQHPEVPCYS